MKFNVLGSHTSAKPKVAIVTGASRGLGLAIATRFAHDGMHVVMCARDITVLNKAAANILVNGAFSKDQIILPLNGDVTDLAFVAYMVNVVKHQFGCIDILVCNAGIYGPIGPVEDNQWNSWVQTIQTNLLSTVLCCREVVPHMRSQGGGKIITLSGGGATQPFPNFSAYASSKAAVVRFTETLAVELVETRIDVNSVSPGIMDTDIHDAVILAGPEKAGREHYDRVVALRQSSDSFIHAVNLISFLASEDSDGITGLLISAIWDDWQNLPIYYPTLDSNAFKLRRKNIGAR